MIFHPKTHFELLQPMAMRVFQVTIPIFHGTNAKVTEKRLMDCRAFYLLAGIDAISIYAFVIFHAHTNN
jgi:hypothetical protein